MIERLLSFLPAVAGFFRSNQNRFLGEILAAVLGTLLGWAINHFTSSASLEACRDEREKLLAQHARTQAVIDSVRFAAVLASKDKQILQLHETILFERQKAASDSIRHLSELDAIRAINAYISARPRR
ncbi:MAG: hypothetical protein J7576_20355 [Siphonobacter aquaeclarae]|nr:hypothetical protein [Siphonobacter aquaeclarae]